MRGVIFRPATRAAPPAFHTVILVTDGNRADFFQDSKRNSIDAPPPPSPPPCIFHRLVHSMCHGLGNFYFPLFEEKSHRIYCIITCWKRIHSFDSTSNESPLFDAQEENILRDSASTPFSTSFFRVSVANGPSRRMICLPSLPFVSEPCGGGGIGQENGPRSIPCDSAQPKTHFSSLHLFEAKLQKMDSGAPVNILAALLLIIIMSSSAAMGDPRFRNRIFKFSTG